MHQFQQKVEPKTLIQSTNGVRMLFIITFLCPLIMYNGLRLFTQATQPSAQSRPYATVSFVIVRIVSCWLCKHPAVFPAKNADLEVVLWELCSQPFSHLNTQEHTYSCPCQMRWTSTCYMGNLHFSFKIMTLLMLGWGVSPPFWIIWLPSFINGASTTFCYSCLMGLHMFWDAF